MFKKLRDRNFRQKIWFLAYGLGVLWYFVGFLEQEPDVSRKSSMFFPLSNLVLSDINNFWWADWVNFTILSLQFSILRRICAVLVVQDMQIVEFSPPIFLWQYAPFPHIQLASMDCTYGSLANIELIFVQNCSAVEKLVFLEVWVHHYVSVSWKLGLIFKANIAIQIFSCQAYKHFGCPVVMQFGKQICCFPFIWTLLMFLTYV